MDGDLPTSFNVLNERNILEDLGFIRTTDKNVDLLLDFIEKESVFSIPVTKENEIKLEGLDLYDCGKWLPAAPEPAPAYPWPSGIPVFQ